jgi:hypothetical protein
VRGAAGRLEHSRERSERGENSVSEWRARGGVRSAVARPRGEKGEGRGGPGVGVPRSARELMGSGPDRRVAPAAARVRRGWATCAARARSVGGGAGERESRQVGRHSNGDGVTDRRGRPVSDTGRVRAQARARARVGRPERRKELGRPTAQYRFGIV